MRDLRSALLDGATIVTVIAALALLASSLRQKSTVVVPGDRIVENWRDYASPGQRLGPVDSRVTIVEFGDYECPACRYVEPNLRAVLSTYSDRVALIYRHFPLPYHTSAYDAARAAECSANQGLFRSYHRALYDHGALSDVDWVQLAATVGVPDTSAFRNCLLSEEIAQRIEIDKAAMTKLRAAGTPTLLVDSLLLGAVPDSTALNSLIQEILSRQGAADR